MSHVLSHWLFEVDRGPDWLFLRAHVPEDENDVETFADDVWTLLDQHMKYRVVLELDAIVHLHSALLGQLVKISKRVHSHGGLIRLCGLSMANQNVLHICRLEAGLPHYSNRADAVMGHRPGQPR